MAGGSKKLNTCHIKLKETCYLPKLCWAQSDPAYEELELQDISCSEQKNTREPKSGVRPGSMLSVCPQGDNFSPSAKGNPAKEEFSIRIANFLFLPWLQGWEEGSCPIIHSNGHLWSTAPFSCREPETKCAVWSSDSSKSQGKDRFVNREKHRWIHSQCTVAEGSGECPCISVLLHLQEQNYSNAVHFVLGEKAFLTFPNL